ncbi:MATE family efflux transporter [Anaerovorax odorimutans]|uniref:MATE family efflux transporter n=1 Tax=Anaerovorax odorimutans TaxID=109327 RepID=A0ABT1RJ76_9FIRM|nr:MATE family efflux transporter [Anaerovorax odorimutans]
MTKERIHDMTSGDPKKLIFKFMLPLMAGNFLQQLYTVADAMIVGKGVGVTALAAIGATDWIYWFMMWAAFGFGQGFSVLITFYFGAKDYELLKKSVNMSIILSLITGAALALIGICAAGPLLSLLHTPANIFEYAKTYVIIMYAGIFVVMMYNIAACILRALGDSSTPFIALVISSLSNIGLDLLFVLVFKWGIAGAAVATIAAQSVSCLYCFNKIRRISILKSSREDWAIDKKIMARLWRKGLPAAFQYAIIAIGGIVVQYALNTLGFLYVAGFTATNKLYGVLEAISLAVGNAMMVYTGQNYGAGDKERIKKGEKVSIVFGAIAAVAIGIIMIVFGKSVLMLFISAEAGVANQVLLIAYKYLFIMSVLLFSLYALNIYRNILMGLGKVWIAVTAGFIELVLRALMAVLVIKVIGEAGIYFVEVAAWLGAAVLLFVAYRVVIRKLRF